MSRLEPAQDPPPRNVYRNDNITWPSGWVGCTGMILVLVSVRLSVAFENITDPRLLRQKK